MLDIDDFNGLVFDILSRIEALFSPGDMDLAVSYYATKAAEGTPLTFATSMSGSECFADWERAWAASHNVSPAGHQPFSMMIIHATLVYSHLSSICHSHLSTWRVVPCPGQRFACEIDSQRREFFRRRHPALDTCFATCAALGGQRAPNVWAHKMMPVPIEKSTLCMIVVGCYQLLTTSSSVHVAPVCVRVCHHLVC